MSPRTASIARTAATLGVPLVALTGDDSACAETAAWDDSVTTVAVKRAHDRFAAELVRRAGNHRIFLVWSDAYLTHMTICPDLVNALLRLRTGQAISRSDGAKFYEPSTVFEFDGPRGRAAG